MIFATLLCNHNPFHTSKKVLGVLFATVLFLQSLVFSAATHANAVAVSLLSDIKKSQTTLSNTQNSISREREKIAQQLLTLEQEVIVLREQTAVARRQADEKTLSLTHLEERLHQWQQQHAYQHNLIQRFNRQFNLAATPQAQPQKITLSQQLRGVHQSREQLTKRLNPQWQKHELILPSGEVDSAQTLSIGPSTWFWSNTLLKGGLIASPDKSSGINQNFYKVGLIFEGRAAEQLQQLSLAGTGELSVDPSLERAMAMAQTQESVIEHIAKGGVWAAPILAFALFALCIASFKTIQLWRLPKLKTMSYAQLERAMKSDQPSGQEGINGFQKQLLTIAASENKSQARDDQLFNQLQHQQYQLNRWLGAIAITAAVSPLLGLLGTVSGMIETFKMMTLFGSGDPEVVSGGIAQALITTELGLVVAIPALILNAVLSRKAKNYYSQLENFALHISQIDNSNPATTPYSSAQGASPSKQTTAAPQPTEGAYL